MLGRVIDIVLPPRCLSCDRSGFRFLCDACDAAFPWIGDERCARCGRATAARVSGCSDCRALRPAFTSARAVARHSGVARDALMRFKLGGERRAAHAMAARVAAIAADPATVTSVPARPGRLWDPGEELARATAAAIGARFRPLLARTRATADQAGLSRAERVRNLQGAFAARGDRAPARIILVDDVMTTGATADACARALRSAGTLEVAVLTFTRAG